MPEKRLPDKGDTYVCAACGETLVASRERQDCVAEYEILHDREFKEDSDKVPVCDDCYQKYRDFVMSRGGKL